MFLNKITAKKKPHEWWHHYLIKDKYYWLSSWGWARCVSAPWQGAPKVKGMLTSGHVATVQRAHSGTKLQRWQQNPGVKRNSREAASVPPSPAWPERKICWTSCEAATSCSQLQQVSARFGSFWLKGLEDWLAHRQPVPPGLTIAQHTEHGHLIAWTFPSASLPGLQDSVRCFSTIPLERLECASPAHGLRDTWNGPQKLFEDCDIIKCSL